MPRSFRLYQVDVFTSKQFEGNPAGVVPNADGLNDREMLSIAREMNNSETAFVFSASSNDHDVHVRFFTPTMEVPICGHATIAAHYVRACEGAGEGIVRQRTGAGVLDVQSEARPGAGYRIWMTQRTAEFGSEFEGPTRDQLIAHLGLRRDTDLINGPIQIVSTGHSKVMIPVADRRVLNAIQPDLSGLAALSANIGCNGYYVFTLSDPDPGALSHGRMFAPAIGINEDPVTGNASGPLGAYLLRHRMVHLDANGQVSFRAVQGEAMARRGSVHVEVTRSGGVSAPIQIRIAGEATIVFQTELRL